MSDRYALGVHQFTGFGEIHKPALREFQTCPVGDVQFENSGRSCREVLIGSAATTVLTTVGELAGKRAQSRLVAYEQGGSSIVCQVGQAIKHVARRRMIKPALHNGLG